MTMPDYVTAADKALAFLEGSILRPGFKEDGHDDVAYFFKAPAAFRAAGRTREAESAWRQLVAYAHDGGSKSANEAYSTQYPMYPWFWMARAAKGLDKNDAMAAICRSLRDYVHPALHGATVKAPYSADGGNTVDFFMTAALGQVDLLEDGKDTSGHAAAAGDTLLRFLAMQREGDQCFFLRMNDAGEPIRRAPEGEPRVFHWVQQGEDGQTFFMLGLPMMHLTDLYRLTGQQRYLDGANQLLAFCEGCGDPLYRSLMAHKVARGAAMLAAQTGNPSASTMALRIADYLLSLQQPSGSFIADDQSMDSYDQTAELALWLREIHHELLAGLSP